MSRYIIDKNKLEENIEIIKKKAGTDIIGVVKGNGYGFGMCELAQILKDNSINTFAVTEVYDIGRLRDTVIDSDILVMRSTALEEEAKIIAENNCIATIGSFEAARVMDAASEKLGKKTRCHLKIDTGMGRYGFMPSQIDEALKCYDFKNLDFCGIYTHFSSAFHNPQLTKAQLELFKDTVCQIKKAGKPTGTVHAANSPALLNVDGVALDAVRIGSAFTGRVITQGKNPLNKIGVLEANVVETKTVPAGYSIGYNGLYKTKKETKLAIVPIGHFDGFGLQKEKEKTDFHSVLSQFKHYLQKEHLSIKINGKEYAVIGEVGLSHTALDITGSDVKIGDIATADISPLNVNPCIPRIYTSNS